MASVTEAAVFSHRNLVNQTIIWIKTQSLRMGKIKDCLLSPRKVNRSDSSPNNRLPKDLWHYNAVKLPSCVVY